MMNAQLMSVMERTREIGTLRALGWSNIRVLWMILLESLSVCFLGGLLGTVNWLSAYCAIQFNCVLRDFIHTQFRILLQAFIVVLVLGLVGGLTLPGGREDAAG
jgi:putative ABC transport system permease protein